MKAAIGWLIGLVFVVSASAEPLFEGQVRLESGEPVADAQVRLFDMSDLRQGAIARALTDGTGYFALPLAALTGRALPERFALGPNYPNPFNPSTIIPYQLAASSAVRLEVFNLLGQHIATLVDGERPAGFHTATWHATDVAGRAVGAGVYIYRMTVGVESQTGRMVLLDGQAGVSAGGAASVMPGASGIGRSDGADAQVYGLIVSGSGLVPYVDSSFRVESGMAPVELVVSSGLPSAGKVTDDDCAFCDLFGTFNDQQEEEEDETPEEEAETDSTSSEGGPDLIVQAPSVSVVMLTPGQEFTLNATVHNQGDEQAAATMLHYYRSNNATITSSDTEVGTDEIGTLDASATSAASIALTAPTSVSAEVGIYYGACVASVSGESNTDNNCSSAVRITVSGQVATEEEATEEEEEEVATEEEEDETTEEEGADGQDEVLVFTDLQIYNDNVFVLPVTDNLAALWTESGNYPPLQDYTARFYEHFNDEFDFLILFANVRRREIELEPGSVDGAFFDRVKNDVQGIGLDTFSNNSNWESAGKLQGVIFSSVYEPYHPRFEYSDFRQGQLLHELMHRWAAYLGEPLSDGHWNGHSNVRGSLGGAFRSDFEEIVDLGGGRYTGAKDPVDPKEQPYPPLELYLAGFIPSEEIPDIWAAVDGEWILDDFEPYFDEETGRWVDNLLRDESGDRIFSAREIKRYTIEDIIAEHGPRVPDHLQSQKDFRAAVILLVSEDYPATREILESVSDDALWFSHVGEDELEKDGWLLWNFYEATGGRGTITMDDLSHFQSSASAKRLVPSSFGTPPPPIVDIRE